MWRVNPLPFAQFLASGTPKAQAAISAIAQSLDDNGVPGSDGLSAYQIWLNAGNTGTVNDFLAALVGAPGADGQDGAPGAPGQDGADGLSAYQIWLNAGNSGTVAQFLASLVGAPGATGPQGPQGGVGAATPFQWADLIWLLDDSLADSRRNYAWNSVGSPTIQITQQSVVFSGGNNLTTPSGSPLQLNGEPLSVAIRMKCPVFNGYAAVFGQYGLDNSWLVDLNIGNVRFACRNSANTNEAVTQTSFPQDVDFTVLVDFDGRNAAGIQVTGGARSSVTVPSSRPSAGIVALGAMTDGSSRVPGGLVIYWLAVWRRLLTATERSAVLAATGKPTI